MIEVQRKPRDIKAALEALRGVEDLLIPIADLAADEYLEENYEIAHQGSLKSISQRLSRFNNYSSLTAPIGFQRACLGKFLFQNPEEILGSASQFRKVNLDLLQEIFSDYYGLEIGQLRNSKVAQKFEDEIQNARFASAEQHVAAVQQWFRDNIVDPIESPKAEIVEDVSLELTMKFNQMAFVKGAKEDKLLNDAEIEDVIKKSVYQKLGLPESIGFEKRTNNRTVSVDVGDTISIKIGIQGSFADAFLKEYENDDERLQEFEAGIKRDVHRTLLTRMSANI